MKYQLTCLAFAAAFSCSANNAEAYEYGFLGLEQPNGLAHGITAASPPAGLYTFLEPYLYQGHLAGQGAPVTNGVNPSANVTGGAVGVLWVPGWKLLGAEYSAVVFQPFYSASLGNPINFTAFGLHNTLVEPLALTWNIPGTAIFARLELGAYLPTGTIRGPAGLNNVGNPWTTFQPTFSLSYLGKGYDLTVRVWSNINTANYITGYRSGDVFQADVTMTKRFGNFKFGPIANYAGQITDDKSSAYYNYLVQNNRRNIIGVGAMGGYDFGPASLEIWAFHDVLSNASGGTIASGTGAPVAPRLTAVLGRLSFRVPGIGDPAPALQAKY